jgi:hypothetical protein
MPRIEYVGAAIPSTYVQVVPHPTLAGRQYTKLYRDTVRVADDDTGALLFLEHVASDATSGEAWHFGFLPDAIVYSGPRALLVPVVMQTAADIIRAIAAEAHSPSGVL